MYMSTHLPMYVFTSQIPTIVISQAGIEPLTVRLMDGQKTLLETTLYPLTGQIRLYDIGKLYEEYIRNQEEENISPYVILELEVGNTTWEDNRIIYCPHNCDIPAEEFITKHFLTTLSAKRIPLEATRDDRDFCDRDVFSYPIS